MFVAGREPERYFNDAIAPVAGPAAFLMSYTVDRDRLEVRAMVAGMAESRAVYRRPFGCVNATGRVVAAPEGRQDSGLAPLPLLAEIAGFEPVETSDPAMKAALAQVFEENPHPPQRHTEAVVVVHQDRVIAERYAAGVGIATRHWPAGRPPSR